MHRATGWAGGLEFRVLGPVDARVDGLSVDVGGPRQRRLVAVLVANANEVVGSDALIERVWDDGDRPAEPQKAIRTYISRLRRALTDGGVPAEQVVVTDPPGYRLALSPHQIDAARFEELITTGRKTVDGDPSTALSALDAAVALWRGSPFVEFADRDWAEAEAARLAELRLVALEERAAARLGLGAHAEVVADLERIVQEEPIRARPVELLMTALFRSDRQVEALRSADDYRRRLIDVGLEPSPAFAELEARVAAGDASLLLSAAPTEPLRGYELAERIGEGAFSIVYRGVQPSLGREVAVKQIRADLANRPEFIRRFEAEAHLVAGLEHPHIVPLHDYWREPGAAYLVMRWLRGGTLESRLVEQRLEQDEVVTLARQVGGALATAHGAGVVHRDVKSPNVFLDLDDNFYLGDFGIAADSTTADDPEALLSVGSPAYASPEQLRRQPVGPSSDVHSFAIVLYEALTGQLPFPDERSQARLLERQLTDAIPDVCTLRPDLPAEVDEVLQRATAKRAHERHPDVETFVDEFVAAIADASPRSADANVARLTIVGGEANPYKGLRPFDEADADDFFGRDRLVDRLLAALRAPDPGGRLVVAVGPSGSGKSSVVRAGLLPRVRQGAIDGSDGWFITTMVPGQDPFEELEAACNRVATSPTIGLVEMMGSDPRGIARAVKTVLPDETTELLLVVDQFEELFTLVTDEPRRQAFLEGLTVAVADPRSRLRVVATIRADFWDRPLRYPELARLLETSAITVPPLAADELERAIVDPARRVGVELEPGLSSMIGADVNDQPGALPLLQYVLTELFDGRSGSVMNVDAYRQLGGVTGALARRAEDLFVSATGDDQLAIQQLFAQLVNPGEGAEDTRRRVVRSDLSTVPTDVVDRFGDARLLSFDRDPATREPTVEVAHEALIREWARLRGWVDERREQLILRKKLEVAVSEWSAAEADPAFLLEGRRLAQFDEWDNAALRLSDQQQTYLDLSRIREQELARRSSRRRRRIMGALAGAALVAVSFGIVALWQREEADQRALDAETSRLGNEAGFVSAWNRELSLLMAVETFHRDPGYEGLSALQRVLVDAGNFLGVLGAEHDYRDVRWVTSDRLVATTEREVHVVNAATGRVTVLPVELGSSHGVAAASPVGLAIVEDRNGAVVLIDAISERVDPFPAGAGGSAFAISDDGAIVAVGYDDGTLRTFGLATGEVLAEVSAIPVRSSATVPDDANVIFPDEVRFGGVTAIEFEPGSRRVVTAGGVFVRVWNVDDLTPAGPEIVNTWSRDPFNVFADRPGVLWFDQDDSEAVVVGGDVAVVRWRIADGARLSESNIPTGGSVAVGSAAPWDGQILVLHETGRVVSGQLDGGDEVSGDDFVFDSQRSNVSRLSVDPSATRLVVASDQGLVVASLDGSQLLADSVPIGESLTPTLSRDGDTLIPGLADDGMIDLSTNAATPIRFADTNVEVAEFAGSPANLEYAAAPHADIVLWTSTFQGMRNGYDVATGEYVGDFAGPVDFVPAWSDDGSVLARLDRNGWTIVEELASGTQLYVRGRPMTTADLDPTGRRAVIVFEQGQPLAGLGGPAVLVDLTTGSEQPLPDLAGGIISAGFTPAGDSIVLIGRLGSVVEVDTTDLQIVRELQSAGVARGMAVPESPVGGSDAISFAVPPVFTADGRWMFSASDGQGRVWDLVTGRQLGQPLPVEAAGRAWGIADLDLLRVVSPLDANALIWNLDFDAWVELACRAAGRNMTEAEWSTFGPQDEDYRASCPGATTEES